MYEKLLNVNILIGKTIKKIEKSSDHFKLITTENRTYLMYHERDCCESVTLDDVIGDIDDLIDSPILIADESTSKENPIDAKPETIEYQDSFTWTFYKFSTIKGSVTIRWCGDSNGYYSESVDFIDITDSEALS